MSDVYAIQIMERRASAAYFGARAAVRMGNAVTERDEQQAAKMAERAVKMARRAWHFALRAELIEQEPCPECGELAPLVRREDYPEYVEVECACQAPAIDCDDCERSYGPGARCRCDE